jgi:hypothetical protein
MLKDAVWIFCAIATLAIQFWALKKPIETKVAILHLSAVVWRYRCWWRGLFSN